MFAPALLLLSAAAFTNAIATPSSLNATASNALRTDSGFISYVYSSEEAPCTYFPGGDFHSGSSNCPSSLKSSGGSTVSSNVEFNGYQLHSSINVSETVVEVRNKYLDCVNSPGRGAADTAQRAASANRKSNTSRDWQVAAAMDAKLSRVLFYSRSLVFFGRPSSPLSRDVVTRGSFVPERLHRSDGFRRRGPIDDRLKSSGKWRKKQKNLTMARAPVERAAPAESWVLKSQNT
ncbi:hypothetical protein C8R44DRAFT_729275 [Mycena epipterygia]|nr:hypothetical protein C8R44DRAFT_729275 [Mycena epipterygia]